MTIIDDLCEEIRIKHFPSIPRGSYRWFAGSSRHSLWGQFCPNGDKYVIRINSTLLKNRRELRRTIKHEFIHAELWSEGKPYMHRTARDAFNKRARELRLGEGDRYTISTVRFYCPHCARDGRLTLLKRLGTRMRPVESYCYSCGRFRMFKSTKRRPSTLKKQVEMGKL